jgi:hypothetical protein
LLRGSGSQSRFAGLPRGSGSQSQPPGLLRGNGSQSRFAGLLRGSGSQSQPPGLLRGNGSQTQVARSRRITPEEQRRRDLNLALRTAARDGDLDPSLLLSAVGPNGSTVGSGEQHQRDLNFTLRTAARDGDLGRVKDALRRGAKIDDRGPKSGLTALDHAEDAGHQEVANYLLSQGGRRGCEL